MSNYDSVSSLGKEPKPEMPGKKSKMREQFMRVLFPDKLIACEEEKKVEQNAEMRKLERY